MTLQAVTDIPCIMFVEELVTAYPNAKVILTNRDADKWIASMENSFYIIVGWKTFDLVAYLDQASFLFVNLHERLLSFLTTSVHFLSAFTILAKLLNPFRPS